MCLQCLFANIALVIFLFKNYQNAIHQPYADYWYKNESFDIFAKKVRDFITNKQHFSICSSTHMSENG